MCPLPILSMAFSSYWSIYFSRLKTFGVLLILANFCIVIVRENNIIIVLVLRLVLNVDYVVLLGWHVTNVDFLGLHNKYLKCHFIDFMAHSNVLECNLLMVHC